MAFQSKRLRVQLPCGEKTWFEQAVAVTVNCPLDSVCFGGSYPCDQNTCVFGMASRVGPGGLCQFPTCNAFSDVCLIGSPNPVADPGAILIDPQDLPALREHLEGRLKDIEAAEQALKERGDQ